MVQKAIGNRVLLFVQQGEDLLAEPCLIYIKVVELENFIDLENLISEVKWRNRKSQMGALRRREW